MTWLLATAAVSAGMIVATTGAQGDEPVKVKKLSEEEVAKHWSPRLKSATEYGQTGGSPKQSPNVAACSFRVVGPTFEELWNHYVDLCGVKQRYAKKTFLIAADAGPKGSYVVSDRASADDKWDRGLSVFLLKTEEYTVTVTFQPDRGGKSISGCLSVVAP